MSSSAYLLVYHGSRDPRPERAARQLAHLFHQQLIMADRLADVSQSPHKPTALLIKPQDPPVGIASLELSIPLHQSIIEFARHSNALGFARLQIIPLFLLPGVHVREDIPREITLAEPAIPETIQIVLKSHLGAYRGLIPLLNQQLTQVAADACILMSHGSRYPLSNRVVAEVSYQLKAIPAYWSVAPDLETQIQATIGRGCQTIAIFPYFLFSGGITDAIAAQVQRLQETYPQIQLYLGEPIGATEALAEVILREVQ